MNLNRIAAITTLAVGLGLGAPALAADDSHHHGHGDGLAVEQLQLDNGKRWTTDAPLRKGMQGVRDDLAAQLPAIHDGKLSKAGYAKLAEALNGHIEYMVVNCKLPPDADAQLHLVLADVIQAGQQLKEGEADGAVRAVKALDAYGRHFEHPGWHGLKH